MNNETEQIFIVNTPESQLTPEVQKLSEASLSTQEIEDFSTVCRTCATVTELVIPIFEGEGLQNNLADKIHKHLPIQVTEQDVLPRVVCYQCANTLLAWHELVQCCVQADEALRTRLAVVESSKNVSNELNVESNDIEINQNAEQDQQDKSEAHLSSMLNKILVNCLPTLYDKENDIQYICQKCLESMSDISQLRHHLKSAHLPETTSFASLQQFVKNYVTFEENLEDSDRDIASETGGHKVEPLPKFFCPFCESVFSSATRLICHLNQHIDMSIDDGVTCCDQTYNSKKTFVKHLQDHHINRVLDESAVVCLSCGFEAEDRDSLQLHITQLHVTGKESTASSTATSKEPSYKNQKFIPAVCPECNKTFSNKYNMFVHMKTHSEASRKFSCDKCNKCYSNRGNLTYHKKIAHEGILSYLCNTCGEAFPSRHARDNHARIHTGYTPYECHYCPKAFRAKNTLDRHIEMHLDIRKYECHVCSKKFRKRTHLNYHLGTHKAKP